MLEKKRVSFGNILEYFDDATKEKIEENEPIIKSPTETIRECVCSVRWLISYVENVTKGRPFTMMERMNTIHIMRPIAERLVYHPDIVHLVTNVRGNLSDLYSPVDQLVADFANMLIELFKEPKQVTFIHEGYIEKITEHKTNLHIMVNIPLCNIKRYNFEQCLSVHTNKHDGLPATKQIKHVCGICD